MAELASITPEIFEKLRIASTATLTSELAKRGLRNTFMIGVRPLSTGVHMVGQAFTLRYIPAREDIDGTGKLDNLTDPQRVAVENVGPNDILVIEARGDLRAGTLGGILATRIRARGSAGIVTDGAFRDSPQIIACGIPAYARGVHAATNKTVHHPTETQVPIGCAGVAVYPGDILAGDDEGVVVIPRHLAPEVAEEAAVHEKREEFILEKIASGASIIGVYPPNDETMDEYREWLRTR